MMSQMHPGLVGLGILDVTSDLGTLGGYCVKSLEYIW